MTRAVEYQTTPLAAFFDDALRECETAAVKGGMPGRSTGFQIIDDMTGGMLAGQLWTIGGTTGSGKSALALCIARHVVANVEDGGLRDVYFASLEMGGVPLVHRLAAIRTGFDLLRIIKWDLTPGERRQHIDALGREKAPATFIQIDGRARLTLDDVRAQLTTLDRGGCGSGGLSLAVVDYMQLMTPTAKLGNREREVAETARGLKQLAMEFKIPVIGCSQLSRSADGADDPGLSHLRESGEIEHASDVVILIGNPDGGVANLRLAKVRQGKRGKFQLAWAPQCTRFSNLSHREDNSSGARHE